MGEDGLTLYEKAIWPAGAADHPLFVGFDKGDHPRQQGLQAASIYRLVRTYGMQAAITKLTAHSLRASGITLMLENKASLWKVQEPGWSR
ncbi:hypothetical protein [Tengunoibacter tsumagoiensis]|uniref:Tyr recombinase domain-containing protein n=1 Tax=Tengunoibacter tsumagoiensis TaxID=2014871 RepID=A0A401ZZZ6_9CHLR|nr:hypothetical protein [Tengunoibacter tsumagoiensis]GCE12467.1 hypothetical protein KTT_23260 [Tengunoibacter tsumagoiensis]